jgi:hypothetical protein
MARLRNATTRCQNDYSSDERQGSQDRWYRNRIVFFFGGVDGANVQDFFMRGVGDALIGERQYSNDDQHDANESHMFVSLTTFAASAPLT